MHALVEDVERAFPQLLIAVLLAVAHDAAVDLVDLLETAVLHECGENLTANTAGAVGDDRLVLNVVVLAGLDLADKVVGGAHVGNDSVLELANLRLERVTAVKEDHFVAALFNKLVNLFRLQVHAAANDAVLIHLQLVGSTESHNLVTCLHGQAREVLHATLGPLELHVLEAGVLAGFLGVRLDRVDFAAEGAVNTVLGNEDAPAQAELLTEGTLPEHDRLRVGDGGELVIQNNLILSHETILSSYTSKACKFFDMCALTKGLAAQKRFWGRFWDRHGAQIQDDT